MLPGFPLRLLSAYFVILPDQNAVTYFAAPSRHWFRCSSSVTLRVIFDAADATPCLMPCFENIGVGRRQALAPLLRWLSPLPLLLSFNDSNYRRVRHSPSYCIDAALLAMKSPSDARLIHYVNGRLSLNIIVFCHARH